MNNKVFSVLKKLRWYHVTRAIGATMVLYELFFAQGSNQQGTVILVGSGILGYDFIVHRSDKEIEIIRRESDKQKKDG